MFHMLSSHISRHGEYCEMRAGWIRSTRRYPGNYLLAIVRKNPRAVPYPHIAFPRASHFLWWQGTVPPPNFLDCIACNNWTIREQHRSPMEWLGKRYQPGWISMYLLKIKQPAVPDTRADPRSISTRTMLPAIDRYAAKPSLCYFTRIEQKYRFCRSAIGQDWQVVEHQMNLPHRRFILTVYKRFRVISWGRNQIWQSIDSQ
jgi:hypothetical protein